MVVLAPSFRKSNAGFSLLELIIVLVIIGVMVASIVISITDTRRDKLHFEARRLAARFALALDEAILTNQELGLEIERDGYRFLFLSDDRWEASAFEEDKQLAEQKLPEGMELQLRVDGLFSEFEQKSDFNKLFRDKEEFDETDVDVENEEDEAALALRPQIYLM
ncbi:MAG: type II secretion system minor pseudopilin GspH, partial [Gammaproteobacteria bacterium]|nr:type II secretion system minor pseudopilin GspH [Gammaproteobacteria bacterium]